MNNFKTNQIVFVEMLVEINFQLQNRVELTPIKATKIYLFASIINTMKVPSAEL
jgi:hypothetical protein